MSTPASVQAAIAACIAAANNTTGQSAANVTEAVNDLISGFGDGDNGDAQRGTIIINATDSTIDNIHLSGSPTFFAILRCDDNHNFDSSTQIGYIVLLEDQICYGIYRYYDSLYAEECQFGVDITYNSSTGVVMVAANNSVSFPYGAEYRWVADGGTASAEIASAIAAAETALGGTYQNIAAAMAAALSSSGGLGYTDYTLARTTLVFEDYKPFFDDFASDESGFQVMTAFGGVFVTGTYYHVIVMVKWHISGYGGGYAMLTRGTVGSVGNSSTKGLDGTGGNYINDKNSVMRVYDKVVQ